MLGSLFGWFKALSVAGKVGVVTSSVVVGGTGLAAVTPESTSTTPPPECTSTTSQEMKIKPASFGMKEIEDPNLEEGKTEISTIGVNGKKKLTYEVTEYSPENCEPTTRELVKTEVIEKPVDQVTTIGTYVAPPRPPEPAPEPESASNCDPNYSGCVPIASDVDCAGGSGNGPAYTSGPVRVTGTDIYGLDADGDGYGCE